MKKISKKLLLSVLSMAFAIVALGTTTFAWFTTNATVKATNKIKVQSTTDSLLISNDGGSWSSSVSFDLTEAAPAVQQVYGAGQELGAVTYRLKEGATELSTSDTFTDLEKLEAYAGNTAANKTLATSDDYKQISFYLRCNSANKKISVASDTWTTTGVTKYNNTAAFTYETSKTVKANTDLYVSAINALRAVVDVSDLVEFTTGMVGAVSMDALDDQVKGQKDATVPMTRQNTIYAYNDTTSRDDAGENTVTNYGQSLAGDNAANAYINAVLGKTIGTGDLVADAKYANMTPTNIGLTGAELKTTGTDAVDSIFKVTITYWLEGFDADCFDAIFGQTLENVLTFKADNVA